MNWQENANPEFFKNPKTLALNRIVIRRK